MIGSQQDLNKNIIIHIVKEKIFVSNCRTEIVVLKSSALDFISFDDI